MSTQSRHTQQELAAILFVRLGKKLGRSTQKMVDMQLLEPAQSACKRKLPLIQCDGEGIFHLTPHARTNWKAVERSAQRAGVYAYNVGVRVFEDCEDDRTFGDV